MRSLARRGRAAFTLVERLVVIGIIAVLVAILLPALNASRGQARSAACTNNMRQIAQSALLSCRTSVVVLPSDDVNFTFTFSGSISPPPSGVGTASSQATCAESVVPISVKTGAKLLEQMGNHLPPDIFVSWM